MTLSFFTGEMRLRNIGFSGTCSSRESKLSRFWPSCTSSHPPSLLSIRQDRIHIFSKANPGGDVVYRELYGRFLLVFVFVGFLASAKRLWMGHHLGEFWLSSFVCSSAVESLSHMVDICAPWLSGRRLFGKFLARLSTQFFPLLPLIRSLFSSLSQPVGKSNAGSFDYWRTGFWLET